MESRQVWPPRSGFFRLRLVRGGWKVPCRITFEGDLWTAIIDGAPQTPSTNPVTAGVDRIWHYAEMIDQTEYAYLLALKVWAAVEEPNHPCLHPFRAMSIATLPPIAPTRKP